MTEAPSATDLMTMLHSRIPLIQILQPPSYPGPLSLPFLLYWRTFVCSLPPSLTFDPKGRPIHDIGCWRLPPPCNDALEEISGDVSSVLRRFDLPFDVDTARFRRKAATQILHLRPHFIMTHVFHIPLP